MNRVAGKPIPPQSRRTHWVERVRPGDVLRGCILSSVVWGVDAHWSGRRTIKCTENPESCPGCIGKMPIRWRGGIHVYDYARREKFFVELTPRAARHLEQALPADEPLRGTKIELRRSGTSPKGRLVCQVLGREYGIDRMPPAEDPKPVLEFLWSR